MFITFLVFVHWRKGPSWYTSWSHKFFYIVTIYDFVVQPIAMTTIIFIRLTGLSFDESYLDSYLLYNLMVNILRLIEYFSKIRPLLKEGSKTIELRGEIEGMSNEEVNNEYLRLKADGDSEDTAKIKMLIEHMNEKVSYLEQPRSYGCGELRIGTRIEVDICIFSLAFICQIKDECILEKFDLIGHRFWNLEDEE